MKHHDLIKGAALLTFISFLTRFMGFFYRIFLSRSFGEENVGLYQLIFPIYALCLAFSSSGIQTVLSRIVAYKTTAHDNRGAKSSLVSALIFSTMLSFLSMIFVQQNAAFISQRLICQPRCEELLIIMTYAIPCASIHSCISGYYFGLKQTMIPAISQLFEQLCKIVCVYFICQAALKENTPLPISFAVAGLVIGEVASSLCSLIAFKLSAHFSMQTTRLRHSVTVFLHNIKELTTMSVPLSANRMILTLLQSIEAVSIPIKLQECSYTAAESLSIYGVLTGMALPCIMFPSAITNSVALLLTPTVAASQSASDKKALLSIVKKSAFSCFSLGLLCCAFFLIFGNLVGDLLFHSALAARFILILAWICPFLYLNTTLVSIINGLGKTTTTFFINMIGIAIRIISIFLIIPMYGLKGYLWGLLLSQACISVLAVIYLRHYLSSK